MKKQPQITEQTRKNIIEAFWALYKKRNIENITVIDIVKKTGYNRSTFYRYFNDTQSVLDYIENKIINSVKDIVLKRSPNTKFNQLLIEDLAKIYNLYGDYFTVLLSENGDPHFTEKFKTIVKPVFYSSIEAEINDDLTTELIYEFTCSAVFGTFSYWSKNKEKMDINNYLEFTSNLLNNGVNIGLFK